MSWSGAGCRPRWLRCASAPAWAPQRSSSGCDVPKIDIGKAPVRTATVYPDEFKHVCNGREKAALGNLVGLTQFGVNLTRLRPGAASALRHWHHNEDEFVFVLEGELVLVEDEG